MSSIEYSKGVAALFQVTRTLQQGVCCLPLCGLGEQRPASDILLRGFLLLSPQPLPKATHSYVLRGQDKGSAVSGQLKPGAYFPHDTEAARHARTTVGITDDAPNPGIRSIPLEGEGAGRVYGWTRSYSRLVNGEPQEESMGNEICHSH